MKKELAIELANKQMDGATISEIMEKANEIFKSNSTDWNAPFAPVDIVFAKFVDYMKTNCSQKELDLVVISEKLNSTWTILHVDMKIMRKEPNEYQKESIYLTVAALKRLDLMNLITKDLPNKIVKWLDTDLIEKTKSIKLKM